MFFLQKHLKSLHIRFAEIDQKLKHVKQKFNLSIDELITYIEKLKTQLFKFSEKYQKYSNFLHALHSHFRADKHDSPVRDVDYEPVSPRRFI